jgi:sulfonate transport system substrate-binding protein
MTIASERQALVAGELRHVNKWYGDHHVLIDVSVRVARGEIVALIGRSGSGKSTVPLSAIWDPYTAQTAAQLPVRSIGYARDVTNGNWFGIASDQALADPKRNTALADLLVRYEKAARWAKDNPQKWAESYAAAVGLDLKVAEVVQGRSLRLPTELNDEIVASEQKIADLFAASGQIASPAPKFDDWVDRRYNDTLRPLFISTK